MRLDIGGRQIRRSSAGVEQQQGVRTIPLNTVLTLCHHLIKGSRENEEQQQQ